MHIPGFLPSFWSKRVVCAPDILGGHTPTPLAPLVQEIVRFRLTPGICDADFLNTAQMTEDSLRRQTGFVARRLVRDHDGCWTDLVTWNSHAAGQMAAATMMADPAFGPFMTMIDGPSVQMSYAEILWCMD